MERRGEETYVGNTSVKKEDREEERKKETKEGRWRNRGAKKQKWLERTERTEKEEVEEQQNRAFKSMPKKWLKDLDESKKEIKSPLIFN